MSRSKLRTAATLLACIVPSLAFADALAGHTVKQPTNWTAIGMFVVFVILTLAITKWAANKARSRSQFYSAGGGITGLQNGLAIAGDYHVGGLVPRHFRAWSIYRGFDGLIYSVGFLVGWPIMLFLHRRALAQSRQIHLCRRRLVPA